MTQTSPSPSPGTRAALAADLTLAGVQPAEAEIILAATGRARHQARINAAWDAALKGAQEAAPEADPRQQALLAQALCLAEAEVGSTGGGAHGRSGDRASARAWWALDLGKGRAHATDGCPWTAAIAAAAPMGRWFSVGGEDVECHLVAGPYRLLDGGGKETWPLWACPLDLPRAWAGALGIFGSLECGPHDETIRAIARRVICHLASTGEVEGATAVAVALFEGLPNQSVIDARLAEAAGSPQAVA